MERLQQLAELALMEYDFPEVKLTPEKSVTKDKDGSQTLHHADAH